MKGVMFDLDGTLLDTLADIGNACNAVLARRGWHPHPLAAYRKMVGNGFRELMRRALPAEAALPSAEFEALVAEGCAFYGKNMFERTRPYEGIPEALSRLAGMGAALSVLSNKPEALTRILIARFFPEIPFIRVCGGRAGTPLKPDPQAVRGILAGIGLEPAQCLYAGDSVVDVRTAQNAGMAPVAVAWGFGGPDELREAGARWIADAPARLPELFAETRNAENCGVAACH